MSSEVTFDEEDSIMPQRAQVQVKQSAFAKLVIKMGLAKDAKQAQYVLLGIALLGFAITLFNIYAFLIPHH